MSLGKAASSGPETETPTEPDQAQAELRADVLLEEALEESFPASDPIASNRFD